MSASNVAQSDTDVIFQEVNLYIEGIQVPYIAISITNSVGELPTATISLPPQTSILEITRFYNPKVHITFVDPIDSEEKVLFSGVITGSDYSKDIESPSTAVNFNCVHRYYLFKELQADYTGWIAELGEYHARQETFQSTAVSSKFALQLAMTGIYQDSALAAGKKEINPDTVAEEKQDSTKQTSSAILPAFLSDRSKRFSGIPGVLLNFWQQIKKHSYLSLTDNEIVALLYIPLVEEGLKFFQRMSGHYFIENMIENDRILSCPDEKSPESSGKPSIVAPSMRIFTRSAVQIDLSVEIANSALQFSGEVASILEIFTQFLLSFDYDLLVLAAPAEVPLNPELDEYGNLKTSQSVFTTDAVDVIVKPQTPFYYSPLCNIVYPNMIRSVSVSLDDYSIPSRITLKNVDLPSRSEAGTFIRAPASIREAIASRLGTSDQSVNVAKPTPEDGKVETGTVGIDTTASGATTVPNSVRVRDVPNGNLASTLGPADNKLGKYEQGRGIRHIRGMMPTWLKYYYRSEARNSANDDGWPNETDDKQNFDAIQALSRGWTNRYSSKNANLNPWDRASGLKGYQRLMVAHADYEFSMAFSRARAGSAQLVFNPYIIPGYPLDILDSTPNHPSFHAYCTSVTHTITASSISTSVSFVSAMTYVELQNYYLTPIHPWLQYSLGLAENQSIMNNSAGKEAADKFYFSTLGVKSAAPTDLFDVETGLVKPVRRLPGGGLVEGSTAQIVGSNGGEMNPNFSASGALSLVRRPIESKSQVETRWGVKFVSMTPSNYNTVAIKYKNVLAPAGMMEPGQSQWLDYDPMFV